jgi:hypothetical protein
VLNENKDEVEEAIYIPIVPLVGGFIPRLPLKFKPVPSGFKELDNVTYTVREILEE